MWATLSGVAFRVIASRLCSRPTFIVDARPLLHLSRFECSRLMEDHRHPAAKPSFATSAHSNKSGGRGRRMEPKDTQVSRGSGGSSSANDKIDALGRLLTRILRHKASELKLNMRNDGYVNVRELLKLNLRTFANIPLRAHTIEDVKEVVRHDNKQRFGLLEEDGVLLIRANQGHSIAFLLCCDGLPDRGIRELAETYTLTRTSSGLRAWDLQDKFGIDSKEGLNRMQRLHVHFSSGLPMDGGVISGMRRDVDVLIFLDVRKALEDGMKLYVSENRVILTEGFGGVVPAKYFQKIESWPQRKRIPF